MCGEDQNLLIEKLSTYKLNDGTCKGLLKKPNMLIEAAVAYALGEVCQSMIDSAHVCSANISSEFVTKYFQNNITFTSDPPAEFRESFKCSIYGYSIGLSFTQEEISINMRTFLHEKHKLLQIVANKTS